MAEPAKKKARTTRRNRATFEALTEADMVTQNAVAGWQPKIFGEPHTQGGKHKTKKAAIRHAKTRWLTHVAEDDENDVWQNAEARGLRAEARALRKGHAPKGDHGLDQSYEKGRRLEGRSGRVVDARYGTVDGRHVCTRLEIDADALRAFEAELPEDMVEALRRRVADAEAEAARPEVVDAWRVDDLENEGNSLVADAAARGEAADRATDASFQKLSREFYRSVGITKEVCRELGVEKASDLDEHVHKAVLGSTTCPEYERVREKLLRSRRTANRGEADRDKDRFKTLLGDEGIENILRARFPKLADKKNKKHAKIITKMRKRVHIDHIFSACCDHPMNLLVDFDTLNEHFGDYHNMAGKARYYGREVMAMAGAWLRKCFEAEARVVRFA